MGFYLKCYTQAMDNIQLIYFTMLAQLGSLRFFVFEEVGMKSYTNG